MKAKKQKGFETIVFETFKNMGGYEQSIMERNKPSCFNGFVSIEKFKVTIEKVEEPKEVLAERLEELWASSHNGHDIDPLKAKAAEIGYEIKGKWASKKVK